MIYTLGYTGRALDDLVALVEQHNGLLMDIRWSPMSRVPWWRKGALKERFGERYLHLPQWGNVNYKNGGPIRLADFPAGLIVLQAQLEQRDNCFIMCACKELHGCHREVVAFMLKQAGLESQEWNWTVSAPPPTPGPMQLTLF